MAVKAGIIGFGYMGHFHLNKTRQVEGVEIAAVYDNDPQKLADAREEGLQACETLEAFLATPELSLVIVSTPNQYHKPYAIAALRAGKNVLCEKPATLNTAELDEILAEAEKAGKFYTVHKNRRWDVDYKVVCDVVQKGTIGNIATIVSRVMGERGVVFGWRGDPESGGGMLYDWGVHLVDQMLTLFEGRKVERISARLLSVLTPAVDDFTEINMFFEGNLCVKIEVGTFALQKQPRWFIYGDRGTLKLDDFSGKEGGMARIKGQVKGFDSVLGKVSLGPSRTMAPLEKENLETLELPVVEDRPLEYWRNLVASVEGKEKPYVQGWQIRRVMQVVDAAFTAAREGVTLKVDI